VLWQQPGITALQVRNATGQWIDAPPIEGTLVVNLGDQFARWTSACTFFSSRSVAFLVV
jgi:isopenicillin N synthase-like dioxygenase